MDHDPKPVLLTKGEAARMLGLTPAAVLALEKRGALSATRTKGGIRLFSESDVLRLATKRDHERRGRQAASDGVLSTESDSIRPIGRAEDDR